MADIPAVLALFKKVQQLGVEEEDIVLAISQLGIAHQLSVNLAELAKNLDMIYTFLLNRKKDSSPKKKRRDRVQPYAVYYRMRIGDYLFGGNDVQVATLDLAPLRAALKHRFYTELDALISRGEPIEQGLKPFFENPLVLRRVYSDEEIKIDLDWDNYAE